MKLNFYKYQGAGNDFLLIDNRNNHFVFSIEQVRFLCDRHFGVGADGLMLLEPHKDYDFKMVYFNSDGNESTMCGNGGRCIAAFAYKMGIHKERLSFMAVDGLHQAEIKPDGSVSLSMQDVDQIEFENEFQIMNTGSPHYIKWVNDIEHINVKEEGRSIRNLARFHPNGINVNFALRKEGKVFVRTYERGVENETLACGTGVTAVAIASVGDEIGAFEIPVETTGGQLKVKFKKINQGSAKDIILTGPALFVFQGTIDLNS